MKNIRNMAECYDSELLALYASNELPSEKMSEVACHLTGCKRCNAIVRDFADWMLAEIDVENGDVPVEVKELATRAIREGKAELLRREWRKIDESFMPRCVYAAAADGQTADQLLSATANNSGFVHFASVEDGNDAWHARITRLPNPTEDSILRIDVADGAGHPVQDGVLRYQGISVEVHEGKAYLPIKDLCLQAERMISLQRVGGPEVPGTLVVGCRVR